MTVPQPTSWRVHLAAQRPGRAVVALTIIFLGLLGIAALLPAEWSPAGKGIMLALAALLLLASIAEFFLPITYTLDADGAHARVGTSHRLLAWARVRRVYLRPDGIQLSPLAARGWIESYRGVYLRTPRRDAVLAQVRAWLDHAGAMPEIIEEP